MGRTLILANRKGGCGKTTLAVHLAVALARGGRVLLVDFDSQAHAGLCLGYPPLSPAPGVAEAVRARLEGRPAPPPVPWKGLVLYPASERLAEVETDLAGRPGVLRDLLLDRQGEFDWVVVDTPPSLSPLTQNALAAGDFLLVPVKTEWLSLVGIAQMMSVYYRVNATVNPLLRFLGVVPTTTDARTRMSRETRGELARNFGEVFLLPELRQDVKFAEATSHGKSLFEYAPRSRGAEDLERLVEEVRRRSGG